MFKLIFIFLLFLSANCFAIETFDGFLVTAYDDHFKVISPPKYKNSMEVVVENKTLVRLVGKLMINHSKAVHFFSIEPDKYQKVILTLKKDDILHFYPLSPAFQEVELIIGNKNYEIPPKK